MATLIGETIGRLLTLLGYDGTSFRPLRVDSSGHPQVDVLSTALPSGASTAANQATIISALQLIDDLRAALTSVGNDSLDVEVLASVLPTGAATQTTLASVDTHIVSLLPQYVSQVMQRNSNLDAEATQRVSGAGPASGVTWVITGMSAFNVTNPTTSLYLGVLNGTVNYWVHGRGVGAAEEMLVWSGEIVLVYGDVPTAYFVGNTAGDDVYFFVFGYVRKAA